MIEKVEPQEKEPARWEKTYVGGGESALVLRRKDVPIGTLAFTMTDSPKGKTFDMQYLAIEKKERSPGVLLKLTKTIQKYCEENEIEYVSFALRNHKETALLKNLGAETFRSPGGVNICVIPIPLLSAELLKTLPSDTRSEIHDTLRQWTQKYE